MGGATHDADGRMSCTARGAGRGDAEAEREEGWACGGARGDVDRTGKIRAFGARACVRREREGETARAYPPTRSESHPAHVCVYI